MLRIAVIAFFAMLFALTVGFGLIHGPFLIGPAIALGLILTALILENFRYRALLARPPGGAFAPTGERFVDPESGKLVVVHADQGTGARRYVAVADAEDTP
jgi:hypothetical protein